MPTADPFDTAAIRSAVLAGWAASPARFREDANAEEALALGGYANRVLVELLANAADAARAVGEPARVRLRIIDDELRVANTGAALTAAGVAALATLRASAKRDDDAAVGHFGVGFTAVVGITDAPVVLSRSGGVQFDRSATTRAVRATAANGLIAELDRRQGAAPALRMPWPAVQATDPIPDGYVTEVRLPLRSPDQAPALAAELAGQIEQFFWALPGLTELDMPDRVIRRVDHSDGTVELHTGAEVDEVPRGEQVGIRRPDRPGWAAGGGTGPPQLVGDLGTAARRRCPGQHRTRWIPVARRRTPSAHPLRPTSCSACPPGWWARSRSTTRDGTSSKAR